MSLGHFIETEVTINQLLDEDIIQIKKNEDNGFWIRDKYDAPMFVQLNEEGCIEYLETRHGVNPLFFLYTLVKRYNSYVANQNSLEDIYYNKIEQNPDMSYEEIDFKSAYESDTLAILKFGNETDFDSFFGYSEKEIEEFNDRINKELDRFYKIRSSPGKRIENVKKNQLSIDITESKEKDGIHLPF